MKRTIQAILVVGFVAVFVACFGYSEASAQSGEYLPTGGTALTSSGSAPSTTGLMSGFGWTPTRLPSWMNSIYAPRAWTRNPSLFTWRPLAGYAAVEVRKAR